MKITTPLILLALLSILYGCKDDEIPNPENSCIKTETTHNVQAGDNIWVKTHYTDEYEMLAEFSDGDVYQYERDAQGNITKKTISRSDGTKYISMHQYDNLNNEVRVDYYDSKQHLNYLTKTYSGSQLESIYFFESSNDSLGWNKYFYENNLLSHIEADDRDIYYYYGTETDSIITVDKNSSILSKNYKKYVNKKTVYEALYRYDTNKNLSYYHIYNREYTNQLLMRETVDKKDDYDEYKFFYDNNDVLIKKEHYLKSGDKVSYTTFESTCDF